MTSQEQVLKVCVVIPCFKVRDHIAKVIAHIGPEVARIFVVDDKCPEKSGSYVKEVVSDARVQVLFNESNLGVGGSTVVGYQEALADDFDVFIKIDGDGQIDPKLIPFIINPLIQDRYDYVKGNRFWDYEHLREMPRVRLVGNLLLSFFAKVSTGYWNIFDPNNGFTAINRRMLETLPLSKIDKRFFFESDMLFRLYVADARVGQMNMKAKYGSEKSNLRVWKIIPEFIYKHFKNTLKRILYIYFLRDFSISSMNLLFGSILMSYGISRGIQAWLQSQSSGIPTPTGTLILVAMSFLSGFQMFLSFINTDVNRAYLRVSQT
jgi:glycosyltransferase involved in cell wall biosynthesis